MTFTCINTTHRSLTTSLSTTTHHHHLPPSLYDFDPTSPLCQNTTAMCQGHRHHLKMPTTWHCWSNMTIQRNDMLLCIENVMCSMQVGQGRAGEGQGTQERNRQCIQGMPAMFFYILYFLLMFVHSSTPTTPPLAPEHVERTPGGTFDVFRGVFYLLP